MENNKPKVSIIVPAYNCEKYIARCIDSIINQTLQDIEIIIVDDGSIDSTLEVLKYYKEKDKRVQLISKENSGVSSSRNKGLELATGKYIAFVDSDDWIDLDGLERMYKIAEEKQTDIVMCSYIREFKDHSKKRVINLDESLIYEGEKLKNLHRKIIGPVKEEFSQPDTLDSIGTVWGKLYKRDSALKSSNKFVNLAEIGTAEDTLFNLMVFKNIGKLAFINECFYHYWKENEESVTTKYNPNMFKQWKNLFNYMENFIEKNRLESEFSEALNNRICIGVLGLGLNECKKGNTLGTRGKINNLKQILNDAQMKEAYSKFELKYFPIHWKIFYCFNKNRMASLSYMMLSTINVLKNKI